MTINIINSWTYKLNYLYVSVAELNSIIRMNFIRRFCIGGVMVWYLPDFRVFNASDYTYPGQQSHDISLTPEEKEIYSYNLLKYNKFAQQYVPDAMVAHYKKEDFQGGIPLAGSNLKGKIVELPACQLMPVSVWGKNYQDHSVREFIQKIYQKEAINKAIILHELGHIHHDHDLKIQIYRSIMTLAIGVNFERLAKMTKLHLFGLGCGSILFEYIILKYFEYQADLYVVQQGYGCHLVSFLKLLTDQNSRVKVTQPIMDTHPPYKTRIEYLTKILSQ